MPKPDTVSGTRPFRQFVLKVHSRCDLACDHCYVYRSADQSWAGRPRVISDRTVAHAARRIAEHAAAHGLPRVHVVLHGGEPLLTGRERLRRIARELRSALDGTSELDLHMQTNGLLLDEEFCAMLVEERILTGISVDGDRASHDRHRRRADGSGSHADVVRAVRLLGSPDYRSAFAGLLCTVDIQNPPVAVYEALADLDPPRIDLLLPHATWDRPPPRGGPNTGGWPTGGTEYADWLIAVHTCWTRAGRPFAIRLFDSIAALHGGTAAGTEAIGLGSPDLVVVETDGEIEQADWLKVVAHGAPATGFHVERHSFAEAAAHPGFQARTTGLEGLSATCRACPVVRTCGGGLYGHRYSSADGFDNPSVYCDDLFRLITHVQASFTDESSWAGRRVHEMSGSAFDELAAGHGGTDALKELLEAQPSLRRGLLSAVRARYDSTADPVWAAIGALDAYAPDALSAVLSQPYLAAWAVTALQAEDGAALPDPGRLAEIALAAAVRAGGRLRLPVPLREGTAQFPLLGRMVVLGPPEEAPTVVEMTARNGELLVGVETEGPSVPVERSPSIRWEPLTVLMLGGRPVPFEDTDPYRDVFRTPPRSRVPTECTAALAARWQSALDEAWETVRTHYPDQAAGVAVLPLALTPLQGGRSPGAAETDRRCFGAIGVAGTPGPADLAGMLVDAVQTVKIGGLLDMFAFIDANGDECYGVPPRSWEKLLSDAYVQTAHPRSSSAADDLAMVASLPLTPLGQRFLDGLRATAKNDPLSGHHG